MIVEHKGFVTLCQDSDSVGVPREELIGSWLKPQIFTNTALPSACIACRTTVNKKHTQTVLRQLLRRYLPRYAVELSTNGARIALPLLLQARIFVNVSFAVPGHMWTTWMKLYYRGQFVGFDQISSRAQKLVSLHQLAPTWQKAVNSARSGSFAGP